MEKIKLIVKGNRIALLGSVDIIAGTVGQSCTFYFDESWKTLNKKISYKVGSTILATKKIDKDEAIIPANVLTTAGLPLEIGITGYASDNSIVTPTSWCLIGTIKNGATVCFDSTPGGGGGGESDDDDDDNKHIIYDGGVIV